VSASSEDEGLPATFLVDDTEATVWSTKDSQTPDNNGPDENVTVKLAKPATISSIQVSAFKNATSARFAALKDFTFQTSDDGVLWKTVKTGGFGYQAPCPAAPDLHDRSFALTTPTTASYVRFFIDSVQGETLTYAQAAELQVFGGESTRAGHDLDLCFLNSACELSASAASAATNRTAASCPQPWLRPHG
jgi:F5/8 type C domain.